MRARRDTNGPRRTYVQILCFKFPVIIENLNSAISPIAYIHVAFGVRGN